MCVCVRATRRRTGLLISFAATEMAHDSRNNPGLNRILNSRGRSHFQTVFAEIGSIILLTWPQKGFGVRAPGTRCQLRRKAMGLRLHGGNQGDSESKPCRSSRSSAGKTTRNPTRITRCMSRNPTRRFRRAPSPKVGEGQGNANPFRSISTPINQKDKLGVCVCAISHPLSLWTCHFRGKAVRTCFGQSREVDGETLVPLETPATCPSIPK